MMPPRVFIFLDYDGTLVPIRQTPEAAVLSVRARTVLQELSAIPRIRVAVISGRSLQSIKRMVRLPEIYYAGNHGLEIAGPDVAWHVVRGKGFEQRITMLARELQRTVGKIPGVLIEHKGITLTVHYRRVTDALVPRVKRLFHDTVRPYLRREKFCVHPGKEVLELRPAINWHKGKAVHWLLRHCGGSPQVTYTIYIGDDVTDESAFAAVNRHGMTIFVGPSRTTHAQYRLKDYRDVLTFLTRLKEAFHGT